MDNPQCYCGSGLLFSDCCGPIVAGVRPAVTAEALMRSRYTANVLKDTVYLLKTWHPSTRPQVMDAAGIPDWCGLTICSTALGRKGDRRGIVQFRALYRTTAGTGELHEKSRFVFEDGRWQYIDGVLPAGDAAQPGKTGRNSPCPCGSGKKYKKCCLK
jgi:SEC-C motif-containing protein